MVALTVTNPLVAHFALSLMTDSLAGSFTMALVACLALAIDDSAWVRARRRIWLGVALLCLVLMAWSRVEKLYVAAALALIAGVWLVRIRRPLGAAPRRRLATVAALFVAALGAVLLLNRATQTFNPRRPPLDFSGLAFSRVVWPRLARVYPYLAPEAQAQISYAEAVNFDAHNNHVALLRSELLERSADNRRILDEITVTTLYTFPLAVLGKTGFDVIKYALPNIAFPLECASILPQSVPTSWTVSRMAEAHPRLTWIALASAEAFFLFVQLPLAVVSAVSRTTRRLWSQPIFWLTASAILINAMLFGLGSGLDAHIRYALPAYLMTHAAVVFLSLFWLYGGNAVRRARGR